MEATSKRRRSSSAAGFCACDCRVPVSTKADTTRLTAWKEVRVIAHPPWMDYLTPGDLFELGRYATGFMPVEGRESSSLDTAAETLARITDGRLGQIVGRKPSDRVVFIDLDQHRVACPPLRNEKGPEPLVSAISPVAMK